MAGRRLCPHCAAVNPPDLSQKCARCRGRLPQYCFSCFAPLASAKDAGCASCGRRRWVFGDFAELRCVAEAGSVSRSHAYMTTRMKIGKVLHEWRCMKCFAEDTVTDAFSHFPEGPLVETSTGGARPAGP